MEGGEIGRAKEEAMGQFALTCRALTEKYSHVIHYMSQEDIEERAGTRPATKG